MRKVLLVIATPLLCVGTQAQTVSSRSAIVKTGKQAGNTQWLLRTGLSIMNFSDDGAGGADSDIGYNAAFGYQKPLDSTGGYWGMEFGLDSRGLKVEDTRYMAHNTQYSPFTFGWKFAVTDNAYIDPYVGVLTSYDYTSKMKVDGESTSWGDYVDYMEVDYNHFDAGMNIDVGVWCDRLSLDLTYQCGFIDTFSDADGFKASNFMIRLSIVF